MPWSWFRVSTGTSKKLHDCMGGDTSARRFEACARRIVESAGAEVVDLKFEPNGRWARIYFYWDDPRVKHKVILDMDGRDVVDLISADDLEGLRAADASGA